MTNVQIFDGAMGTMLQQRGLLAGQSPEELLRRDSRQKACRQTQDRACCQTGLSAA